MRNDGAQTPAARGVLRRTLRELAGQRWLLALSLLLAVAIVAAALTVPILIGRAIDLIAGAERVAFPALLGVLSLAAAVAGAGALLQWLMGLVNNRVTYQTARALRNAAFEKIGVMPLRRLDAEAHGEIVSRVVADVDQLADGLLLGVSQLFTAVVTILGTLVFMLAIDWKIGLVVVLLTPLSLVSARVIAGRTYRFFRAQSDIRAEQTGFIDEAVQNQKVVQAFSQAEETQRRFDEIDDRLTQSYRKATFYSSITNPATRFVNALVYAGVALAGALTAIATGGAFTVGSLAVFLSYAAQYTKPFNEISGVVAQLQGALACAERVFALIDEAPQAPDAPDAAVLADMCGDITFEDVSFSYEEGRALFESLSFSVKPGRRVAIVGPTGCGKTTVINLLMRFFEADGGAVLVEGRDVKSVTRKSLRQGFGMVLQDTWLKAGTIRENITLGKPGATQAEIEAAARATHAHGFIQRLPEGYDTVIGEDGGSLSGGEKQLLCITRVMLRLPPVLILDEATSSIDTRTEQRVQAAFSRLMEGRTTIVVAHRLSTIREYDVILVMDRGRIVERGTHEELLKKDGFYARLYHSQFVAT